MTTKTTKTEKRGGLAAFSSKRAAAEPVTNTERIRRGSGDSVAITVRMSKDNWMKMRQFAMHEGETLQTIAMNAFNRELAAKGLPPLDV